MRDVCGIKQIKNHLIKKAEKNQPTSRLRLLPEKLNGVSADLKNIITRNKKSKPAKAKSRRKKNHRKKNLNTAGFDGKKFNTYILNTIYTNTIKISKKFI